MDGNALRYAIHSRMPELDALRGIAILWVILHNAALDGIGPAQSVIMSVIGLIGNMGWVGVQLFFVLSGFLITGILVDGRGFKHQFRNFYVRRTLRIFPLYYGFLLFAFVILPWLGFSTLPDSTQTEKLLYWTYLANWGLLFVEHQTFPHLWSLAIEEQYYLIWPLLVILLQKRTLAYICLVLIVTAIASRASLVMYFDPDFSSKAMYTFTIARWDSLAIGSLLALLVRSDSTMIYVQRFFSRVFLIFTTVLILQILLLRNFSAHGTVGIFNQTTIALWFAMLILLSISPSRNLFEKLRQALSNKFLRWIGKYSYAIYVFHVPAKMIWFSHLAFAGKPDSPWYQLYIVVYNFIGISALATSAAYISWHVLEQPFLKLKRYFVYEQKIT